MRVSGLVGATLLSIVSASATLAQVISVPAEFPPESFTGNSFVDSRGCAFVRAGLSGNVTWVPRVARDRTPLCNFQPTLGPQNAQTRATTSAPNPLAGLPDAAVVAQTERPDLVPTARPAATAAVAPRVAAPTPAPNTNVGAPIQTVASLTTAPRLIQPVATAASPRVIAAPAPEAPARPRTTLAQACEGRFGIQTGFISASTGQPINCGPAPVVQQVAAVTPADVTPAVAGPRRLTLAQACAEIAATGRALINAATGLPVACAPAAQPTIIAANTGPVSPAAPSAPRAPVLQAPATTFASACSNVSSVGAQYLTGGSGLPVRCGPQTQSPSGFQVTRRATASATVPFFGDVPVPASNPVGAARVEPTRPPAGYERVWGDGRLNPQRGLPRAQVVQPASQVTARVSTRSVAPQIVAPVATAAVNRYVQIGTFRDAGNAQRTTQRLQSMGLPVAAGQSNGMQIIAVGPFGSDADLQRALLAARGAGFTDAFARR